ncbi:flavodoxin domain-containing protein [Pararhodobacter zhoushanensis]|uniref:flavodoxin domain-containing protein n=1 Tax=Pararhodobacter zhoushanensis TaxID=2479545 RepID=UPI000F8C81B2|nr:flavodoxin domain-containing protein [Pararhodobacter zhoushanensis]
MQIALLYGTETGNAEMLAEDIAAHLSDHDASVTNLSDFDPADFDTDTFYIVVCSTYGDGELPASAQPFAEKMEAQKPSLDGIRFAVFGMGDSEYPETYNFGGKRMEELLAGAGAELVGERVTHNASGDDMADDLALPWVDDILAQADA